MKRPTPPPLNNINRVAKRLVGRHESVIGRKSVKDSLVSLSGLIGAPVKDQKGFTIGKLVDVVVRNGEETYPPVSGLIVKVGPRQSFINGARISQLTQREIILSSTKINLEEYTQRPGESLLDGDVLDHQIVEIGRAHV